MLLGYARVSTADQAAEGTTSLQEQQRAIQGFAMMKGISSFDMQIYTDAGISAAMALRNRPAGYDMWHAAQEGDIIIASKLDRIFRDSLDALHSYRDLKERKVDLVLLDMGVDPVTQEDGIGKLMFTMLSAFADWERTRIATRMRDGKTAKIRNGGHAGGEAPYGFRIVGSRRDAKLEINADEQQVIERVVRMHERHRPWVIARRLNEDGVPTRSGKPWQDIQIMRIVARNKPAEQVM